MGTSGTLIRRLAPWVARASVGALLIYAGWIKARDPAAFIRDLWNYRLLPEPAAYWISAYAPFLEIVTGAALITGLQRRGAELLAALLLVVFIGFLATAWVRGLDIACGCFGGSSTEPANYPLLIGRNLALLGAIAFSAWSDRPAARAGAS